MTEICAEAVLVYGWQNVNRIERESREIHEVHVTVEATVQAEIAEVGGHPFEVGGVVAKDRDGYALIGVGGLHSPDSLSDVKDELVVATLVGSDEVRADPKGGGLAGALKMQDGSAIGEWIGNFEMGAVPALAAEVRLVGVACVGGVEAVRQSGRLPLVVVFRTPGSPDSLNGTLAELPPGVKSRGGHCGTARGLRLHCGGAQWWAEQNASGRH